MSEEQKRACYDSYLGDLMYEWGTTAKAMSFEEFCEECDKFGCWEEGL